MSKSVVLLRNATAFPHRNDSCCHALNTHSRLQAPGIHKTCRTICTQYKNGTTIPLTNEWTDGWPKKYYKSILYPIYEWRQQWVSWRHARGAHVLPQGPWRIIALNYIQSTYRCSEQFLGDCISSETCLQSPFLLELGATVSFTRFGIYGCISAFSKKRASNVQS